jgi:hypothetical protein
MKTGFVVLAPSNAAVFEGAHMYDLMVYPSTPDQRLLLGTVASVVRDGCGIDPCVDAGLVVDGARVGVGNSTPPMHTLDVRGDINLTGTILRNGAPARFEAETPQWSNTPGSGALYLLGSNVGIGTDRPSAALDVVGGTILRGGVTLPDGFALRGVVITPNDGSSTTGGPPAVVSVPGLSNEGPAGLLLWVPAASNAAFRVGAGASDGASTRELLRVTGDGRVGVGTDAPQYPLHIAAAGAPAPSGDVPLPAPATWFSAAAPGGLLTTDSNTGLIPGQLGASPAASVYAAGYVFSGRGFVAASDARIKMGVVELEPAQCAALTAALRPVSYEYVDRVTQGGRRRNGFLAQEVEAVVPECVSSQREVVPTIMQLCALDLPVRVGGGAAAAAHHLRERTFRLRVFDRPGGKSGADAPVPVPVRPAVGDLLRCFDLDDQVWCAEVVRVDGDAGSRVVAVTVRFGRPYTGESLFVYGPYVADLRAVEHEQLIAVLVGAVQDLSARLARLEEVSARLARLENK